MQSNIARALDRDPDFAWRVPRLHVMGGVFAPIRVAGAERPPSADHNLMVDPEASVRALNAGVPTRYTPLNVTVGAPLLRSHLDVLRSGDELCRTLARLIDIWADITKQPGDVVALLHDPLTVACVVDRRYVTIEDGLVTVVIYDGVVRTFIDNVDGRRAEVVSSVDGPGFADFWLETVMG
jgi:inosine-uridine nucleoside N-ribohydrolase